MQVSQPIIFTILGLIALTSCTDRSFTPVVPSALDVGTPVNVLSATTRAQRPDGNYGYERSNRLQRLNLTISVPPSHTPGDLKYSYAQPDPETQFTLAARHKLTDGAALRTQINRKMNDLAPNDREVTVYIHGYNTTQAETAFRAAQLAVDINLLGPMMIYSWPSQGKSLGYAYDIDSALFARDGLQQLLFELSTTRAHRIILVAHSMGSLVLMETLRQIEQHKPGWVGKNISGVMLISPDLDVELFRAQMNSLSQPPQPFVLFVSGKDRLLSLSARIRGGKYRHRLGNIKGIDDVADLPVEIIDTTAFSDNAQSQHFVVGSSPALLAMINKARSVNRPTELSTQVPRILLPGDSIRRNRATRVTVAPTGSDQ